MAKHHAAPKERRFVANNVKTWRVVCSQCGCIETIGTNKGRPLPPNIIIKKLTRIGWRIDGNPKHDLCAECIRKPIKARLPLAAKALTEAAAPMVANGKMHFSELKSIANTLDPQEAKQLIEVLRERIPPKPKIEKQPKSEPQYDDKDYERWLNEQETNAAAK